MQSNAVNREEPADRSRDLSLDRIRILAMLLVILNHVPEWPTAPYPLLNEAFAALIVTCNGIFYMLSGHFNLRYSMDTPGEYAAYYRKKAVSILYPYVLTTVLLCLWDVFSGESYAGGKALLKYVWITLMSGNAANHMWFMYPLAGLLLGAPFLAKLLHRLSDFELHLLMGLGLAWNVLYVYLGRNTGAGFEYSNWLLASWSLFFFAGYYFDRCAGPSLRRILYPAGLIGYLITVAGRLLIPGRFFNSLDLAPAYAVFTFAMYDLLRERMPKGETRFSGILVWAARHSFLVYMIHCWVSTMAAVPLIGFGGPVVRYLLRWITAAGISLLIAAVMDALLLAPVRLHFTEHRRKT